MVAIVVGNSKTKIQDNIAENDIKLTWLKKNGQPLQNIDSPKGTTTSDSTVLIFYIVWFFFSFITICILLMGKKKHQQAIKNK